MTTPTLERPRGDGWPSSPPPAGPPPVPRPEPASSQLPLSVIAGIATFCTTLCLSSLFAGLSWWLLPSTGAIAVAVIAGELGRRIQLPVIGMPLVYLVLGWIYVILVGARGAKADSGISLVPSASTFHGLRVLANSGSTDIRSLTVPVPDRPGFLFLTVAGVFLIAALVDVIAVGLDHPAAAGLPLLVLLAVPSAVVSRGIPLLAFLAAAAAYVALLLASGRRSLARWARLPPGSARSLHRVTGAAGRRIGAVAIVASLLVAALIPRYAGIAHRHGGGGGSDSATVIEPVVTLGQQLHSRAIQPLLTVHTNNPQYLRLTALEYFDGETFTLGSLSAGTGARISHGLPGPAPGVTDVVRATVDVKPALHQHYLPVPYQATKVAIGGDWRLASRNFTIFSAKNDTSKAHYTVTSEVPTPTVETLRSASADPFSPPTALLVDTQLPADLPQDITRLERSVTEGLTTEYDRVAAIQAYLRGPRFTYDLTGAPAKGPNALAEFLFKVQRGYCEQFAGAMAALVRAAGYPARVAVGFTPGTSEGDGSYLVTNHDAHSWPEVWFPQAGWVRFEPTKRDDSTTPPTYTTPTTPAAPSAAPSSSASAAPSAGPSTAASQPRRHDRGEAAVTGGSGQGGGPSVASVVGWSLGVLALIVLLGAPGVLRRRRRRSRLASADPRELWHEIMDTALDLGFPLFEARTPRNIVTGWAKRPAAEGRLPFGAVEGLSLAAAAVELARYAPDAGEPFQATDRVQIALTLWRRSVIAPERLRAALLPRSVLADAATWTSELVARLRTAIRRRLPAREI